MLLGFLSRTCQKHVGQQQEVEGGLRHPNIQQNEHGCMCEPTAWRKGEQKALTLNFTKIFSKLIVDYGSVGAGAYPGELQPPLSACWKAQRLSPWIQLLLG